MADWIRLLRLRLAVLLFGDGWSGCVSRLWLIRERAMAAVTKDGRVNLAECQALADALYADIPGNWQLTLSRVPPKGENTDV